jgi:hypothetical protein
MLDEQVAFVAPSRHRGRTCLRFAVVNPLTTVEDLADLIASGYIT